MGQKSEIMSIKEITKGSNSGIVRGEVMEIGEKQSKAGKTINSIKITDGGYSTWVTTWDNVFAVGDCVEISGYTEEYNGYWNIKVGMKKYGGYIKIIDSIEKRDSSIVKEHPPQYFEMSIDELYIEHSKEGQEGWVYGMLNHIIQRQKIIDAINALTLAILENKQ